MKVTLSNLKEIVSVILSEWRKLSVLDGEAARTVCKAGLIFDRILVYLIKTEATELEWRENINNRY